MAEEENPPPGSPVEVHMEGVTRAAGDGAKRRRCDQGAADLLSELPESLLLHILSFMRMEDIMKTTLLSRRWRYLWTSTPSLDFSRGITTDWPWIDHFPPDFIDRALLLHDTPKIRTFRAAVCLPDEGKQYEDVELCRRVDSWVRFAVRRQVEELELNCLEIEIVDRRLPNCVFTCESLVSLSLLHCLLNLPSRILMSSLKILSLYSVSISDDNLNGLLSGCPSLECLTLHNCPRSFYRIRVKGSRSGLKTTLKICDDGIDEEYGCYEVRISAPSITTLVFSGYLRPYYAVKDLSSIVTACLDFRGMFFRKTGYDDYEHLLDLVYDLRHVQVLKLCSWCIQALFEIAPEGSPISSEFNIISLELAIGFITCEFPGIFCLLRNFTKLEFLIIDIVYENERITLKDNTSEYYVDDAEDCVSNNPSESYVDDAEDCLSNDECTSTTPLQDLKTISISGLGRAICAEDENNSVEEILEKYQNGFEFIQFLLENSPILERLMINAAVNANKLTKRSLEVLSTFGSRLLALPRASPKALVIIQDK